MNTKEQADKEYRAQWIRETTREFMIAHLSVGAEQSAAHGMFGIPYPVDKLHTLASSLWDRYEQERK